ncbi:carbon-nitrogen hydrolase family protein [Corynebacterium sp. 153RC1]|uniref:carbon-nitrogen hydrolase family protein n=1 Tax=unclassified Corynebacterium TaxID=2624378 RepID=UPI00211C38D9|nr:MULTISPECIES: carbon-nitrogen hydrolase family protein [unclassified Corynebacterium]MCQ9371146.1 carbon-nitrogen hydrolase family protein [Corynebacterium sp. 35RC1]MCQ9352553.1 carbon-nitrogen hydrolase family protein [Corynebacterium sp. 209RC1]MCQ9354737.1 carbon-nitrogen hydrolase family protein [Corynebacterium sp. 1222RC1]MCQ9356848.1 carbon-nitrogen hydrolase family protein [Corynebacterium sp. 122RC1]MCQ9358948.1 carbon-nitrogen hydrolase family protein [Corynebacterium sp. 142RC1]
MLIALAQITSGKEIQANLELVKTQAQKAAEAGARVVVFPEATSQAFGTGRLDTQAEPLDGSFASAVRELADELGITIVLGMFEPADTKGEVNRIYNVALVASPNTANTSGTAYRKIHTYDAFGYKESDTVKPGSELATFTVDGVTFGVAICYDVRFPGQFRALAAQGAEVIVLPTSWADGEGKLEQWRTLTAARALDSTTFILAAGQARPEHSEERSEGAPTGIGHSAVIAPDGTRIAEAGYAPELLLCTIDVAKVAHTRKALPVLEGTDTY